MPWAHSPCKALSEQYNLGLMSVGGREPCRLHSAGVAQLVEHNVANVVVVGSNPITRSSFFGGNPTIMPGRQGSWCGLMLFLGGGCHDERF